MDPATLTASALAALARSRQISAEEATRATLARIAKGEDPGPRRGVPVTVRVNIDQAGFAATTGLRTRQDLIATEGSPPVANLRRA